MRKQLLLSMLCMIIGGQYAFSANPINPHKRPPTEQKHSEKRNKKHKSSSSSSHHHKHKEPPKKRCCREKFEFLTPDNCFFLFSDNYQSGLMNLVKTQPMNEFENAVHAYIDIANYYHIPCVVTSSAADGPNGPLVSTGFTDLFCPDVLNIFHRSGPINIMDYAPARHFIEQLKCKGRTKVVVNGIATDVSVLFPVMSLLNEGFDVYVATDASGTTTKLVHDTAISLMQQQGAKLTNWFMVGCWMQKNWLDPDLNAEYGSAFEPLLSIVRKHYPEYDMLTWSKYGVPPQPINDPCD